MKNLVFIKLSFQPSSHLALKVLLHILVTMLWKYVWHKWTLIVKLETIPEHILCSRPTKDMREFLPVQRDDDELVDTGVFIWAPLVWS